MPMLIRTWNLFHGNTQPPRRRSHLREMLTLAASGDPDVVCLQELPVWSLTELESWSGMRAFPAVARRGLRPVRVAGWITRLHNGLLRSAIAGQANAILVARAHEAEPLGAIAVAGRGREPRICQAVRVGGMVVGNTHLSSIGDADVQEAELGRCVAFLERLAGPGEPVILAGDLNRRRPLVPGFSGGSESIDHILVRGAHASPPSVWPLERRLANGLVLSDHAPVEVMVT